MPVKKKYEDEIRVGGAPAENIKNVSTALEAAGFKKVVTLPAASRVTGNWKPLMGTLWGDITVTLVADGPNTLVSMVSVAAVDNAYALAKSPGGRIFAKFLDAFLPLVSEVQASAETASTSQGDVSDSLQKLASMYAEGLLTQEEFDSAKAKLLS